MYILDKRIRGVKMTNDLIQLLVKTEYRLNDIHESGTGFLVCAESDDYDYVFTSLHCIEGINPDINGVFKLNSKTYGELHYTKNGIHKNKELDLAIVKVNKILRNIIIYHQEYEVDKKGFFIGYPEFYTDKSEETEVTIKFCKKNRVHVDMDQFHYGREKCIEIFGGFSGSPVFFINNNFKFLSGIIVALSDPKFITQQINFVPISEFLKIICDKGLSPINTFISSMLEVCIGKTFKSEEAEEAEEIYTMLDKNAKKLEKIDMNYYMKWLNKKMFLPYGEYPMFEETLWIGWIKYLTFMYLISDNDFYNFKNSRFDEIKFLQYIKVCRNEGIKYFHSYACKTFQDLIPILYENNNVYKDLNFGDTVIVNFGKLNPRINHIPSSKLSNIVKNIGNGDLDNRLMDKYMDITSTEINKALDILHISYFEDYLCKKWNFCSNKRFLEPFIRTSLQEVIKSVKGAS